jgi:hypothetical protein
VATKFPGFTNHISRAPRTRTRWRASACRVCTRWRGCPRVPHVPGGRYKRRAFPSTTHAHLPRSPDSFHVVSNRTRFGTPSSPSGWTRHEGTGVLFATRERPGVGRWHRATNLYLRKAKLLAKHLFHAGACFPRPRLFTISPAKASADKTLFAHRRTIWHSESPKVVNAKRWIKKVRNPH